MGISIYSFMYVWEEEHTVSIALGHWIYNTVSNNLYAYICMRKGMKNIIEKCNNGNGSCKIIYAGA